MTRSRSSRAGASAPSIPANLIRHLDFARAAKTPYELLSARGEPPRRARAYRRRAGLQAGASEFEIELAFLRACGLREQELPYNPIIALNEAARVLHYQVLEQRAPAERHSLLIDAGAEFAGYASDITRTYSLRDAEFAALIGRMDGCSRRSAPASRRASTGATSTCDPPSDRATLLREADITTCGAEEAVASGVTSVFLPHGIGHLLGLEVHDVGRLHAHARRAATFRDPQGHPFLRLTRVLQRASS